MSQDSQNENVNSSALLKCILHIGKENSKANEPLKKFSQEQLDNCRKKSLVYKFRKKSDYGSISIPECVSESTGFHKSCYSNFTAVKAKELLEALEKQKVLDEQSAVLEPTSIQQEPGIIFLSITVRE